MRRFGVLLALVAVAGVAVALLLPRGGLPEGIAWEAPAGERVILAGHGLAIMRDAAGQTLTGRDLATGDERWRLRLRKPATGEIALGVSRVGVVLLVHSGDGTLSGVDFASGSERWHLPGASGPPVLAGPGVVAAQRCDARGCFAEVRSVADGRLRWRTPATVNDSALGAPRLHEDEDEDESPSPLWPASVVLLRPTPTGYDVRDILTGAILRHWTAEGETVAITGATIVRSGADGTTWGVDALSGRELWRRAADGLHPARSPTLQAPTLALPGGTLLFSRTERVLPTFFDPDAIRMVDPRTGRASQVRKRVEGDVTLADAPTGELTAAVARSGLPPSVPVFSADGAVQADGRVYETGSLPYGGAAVTPTQVGWDSDQDGAEVHDRRTGRRLVHLTGDQVTVRAAGERVIVTIGGRDHVVAA
jgi:hypothetical protein